VFTDLSHIPDNWLRRHPHKVAAVVLVFVLHLCFFPFIWGDRTLLSSARSVPSILPRGAWAGEIREQKYQRTLDAAEPGWHSEPSAAVIGDQYLREKNWPLWNPYQAYGTPLAANMQSQPFNPLFALFSIHPTPWTYNIFLMVRLFLAGFFAYLFLSFFVGFFPSLTAGIASLLTGFNLLYITMPHVSVSVLLPALFFTIELLLRKPGKVAILGHAFVTLFVLFGGNPQSALLALSLAYCYFLFRVISEGRLRSAIVQHGCRIAAGTGIGFGMAAMLLLPFLEFMRVSFDTHQSQNLGWVRGLAHDSLANDGGLSWVTYLIPLVVGPPWSNITHGLSGGTGVRGYWGVITFSLSLIGFYGAIAIRGQPNVAARRAITAFFGCAATIILLKRFGFPGINWVGGLPLFNLIDFALYDEPLLGFCMAALAGLGAEVLFEKRLDRRSVLSMPLFVLALLGGAFVQTYPLVHRPEVEHFLYFYGSLGLGIILVLLLALSVLFLRPAPEGRRLLETSILILLTADLSLNFIAPLYYRLDTPASASANPYLGSPMVDFLKSRTADGNWRILGCKGFLFPDWAGVFRLADIRDLDDMYYKRYLPFVKNFLPPGRPGDDELFDRFTGAGDYSFDADTQLRLLQLSSVKYLISPDPYGSFHRVTDEVLSANAGPIPQELVGYLKRTDFVIGARQKPVLFEHPPYKRLPYRVSIGPGRDRLLFSVALDSRVYENQKPDGEGVEFRLEVKDETGEITEVYDRYIDPKSNLSERDFIPGSADLKKFTGRNVELLFSTLPGPKGDNRMDWSGWAELRFEGEQPTSPMQQVYKDEARIYEYGNVLPRAAVFHRLDLVTNGAAALAHLKDPAVDVLRTVIVEDEELDEDDRTQIREINRQANPGRADAARITTYSSQRVAIEASLQEPGLLQLNDANYPGWKVYVDGQTHKRISTDFLFRGVFLPAGNHSVEFRYEPESFRIGLWTSGGFLLLSILYALLPVKLIPTNKEEKLAF
jgi:hypothetical protein